MNLLALKKNLQPNSDNLIAVCVFCLSLCYYLGLLHTNIAHAHDAPTYYHHIMTMNIDWNTHHVLYEPLAFIWLEYAKLIFPQIHPFKLASSLNSFFGAGCNSLVYLILVKRLNFLFPKALICCVAIGTSFYYVNYATTVEVYHTALFFMLATFYYATKTNDISFSDAMVIGILHGIGMSFHQMHVLLGIVLFPRIFKSGYSQFFIYVLYGSLIVVFTYLLACYAEHIHSIGDFKNYFLGYMRNEKMVSENSSPLLAPFGLGIALLGGRYLMAINPFKAFIEQNFSDSLYERIFYLHHSTGVLNGSLQILCYVIFFISFVYIIKCYIKTITLKHIKLYSEYYVLICVYSVFFTFWYPHNPEFWGVSMTFMIIVIFQQVQSLQMLGIISASIFIINLLGSGLPLLDLNNNFYPEGVLSLFNE